MEKEKPIDMAELKRRVDIKEALIFYGVVFDKKGKALCPFHKEKTPSLFIKGDRYKCFGCGESGDIIDFVQFKFNLDFKEALKKIDTDFHLNLRNSPIQISKEEIRLNKIAAEIERKKKEKYEKVYNRYCFELRVLRKTLKSIGTESENGRYIRKRIAEIEEDLDDTSGISIICRFEKEGGRLL